MDMNNLTKQQQLEVLTQKYVDMVQEVARELYYDDNLPEDMDPFDYLFDTNPEKANELLSAFRILQSASLELDDDE